MVLSNHRLGLAGPLQLRTFLHTLRTFTYYEFIYILFFYICYINQMRGPSFYGLQRKWFMREGDKIAHTHKKRNYLFVGNWMPHKGHRFPVWSVEEPKPIRKRIELGFPRLTIASFGHDIHGLPQLSSLFFFFDSVRGGTMASSASISS